MVSVQSVSRGKHSGRNNSTLTGELASTRSTVSGDLTSPHLTPLIMILLSYDGELHIVHYNTKYHSFSEALDKPDGLAVVGVFLTLQEEGEAGCEELDKICQKLREIKLKNTTTIIKEDFNPERVLPSDRSYFSYLGSLTTPPLLESVTWLIFKQPIKTTKEQVDIKNYNPLPHSTCIQLAEMTSLSVDPTDSVLLSHNCRPVCPLAGRTVAFYQHK